MSEMICHPLTSVCVLLNAIDMHFDRRDFISSTLTEALLPKSVRIIYKSAAEDKTREDALPIIAYDVAGIGFTPYMAQYAGDYVNPESTAIDVVGSITFAISTTNEALTRELSLELAQFCMSIHKEMQNYQMSIDGVEVSGVKRGKANYFDAQVNLKANLGRHVWNHSGNSGILREIGIKLSLQ